MNDDHDLQKLWQSNQPEKKMTQTISLSDIRAQSSALERKVKFRNVREYAGASIVVVAFGWRALHAHSWLEAAGCVELVATAIWITFALLKSAVPDPGASATLKELLAFHRSQLDRQIKLLSHAMTWYLTPIAVGMAALITADLLRLGSSPLLLGMIATCVLLLAGVALLNRKAAAKLENDRALLPQDDA